MSEQSVRAFLQALADECERYRAALERIRDGGMVAGWCQRCHQSDGHTPDYACGIAAAALEPQK